MTKIQHARLTGFFYLLVILLAGFSQGYVRGTIVVPDNAPTTAANMLAQESLYRWGLVTDLLAFVIDAIISVLFYQMFRSINRTLAMVTAALRLLAHPAIASLNLLNHYLALKVIGGAAFLSVFDADQLQSMSMIFLDAHRVGYLLAGAFFGVHCLLLGVLIVRSQFIPRILGFLLYMAAFGYLMETFGDLLFPGNEQWLAALVGITAAIGEISLMGYLIIKGQRQSLISRN